MSRASAWRRALTLLALLSLDTAGGTPASAVCISGQARTLPDTAWKIRKRLLEPWEQFGGAASFVFVSRRSYYPAWKQAAWGGKKWRVPDAEMDRALRVLRPAAYVVYDENATSVELPPGRSTLCSDTSREQHWSSQARQFWSIARCFGLVAAHERAAGFRFAYFVRFRADAAPKARVPSAIGEAAARAPAARALRAAGRALGRARARPARRRRRVREHVRRVPRRALHDARVRARRAASASSASACTAPSASCSRTCAARGGRARRARRRRRSRRQQRRGRDGRALRSTSCGRPIRTAQAHARADRRRARGARERHRARAAGRAHIRAAVPPPRAPSDASAWQRRETRAVRAPGPRPITRGVRSVAPRVRARLPARLPARRRSGRFLGCAARLWGSRWTSRCGAMRSPRPRRRAGLRGCCRRHHR